jgi:hypothetical protein
MPRSAACIGAVVGAAAFGCEIRDVAIWVYPIGLLVLGVVVSFIRGGEITRHDALRDLVIYGGLLQGAVCAGLHVLPGVADREQALAVLIGLAMMVVHALERVVHALTEGTRPRATG